jgi:hypothetical protein
MPRPPETVAFIARTHWLMSGVFLFFNAGLYLLLRDSTVFDLSQKTHGILLGLSAGYALAGILVWYGAPPGRLLNYVCSLLYLARPPLGMRIWKIMRSEEYQAHFRGSRSAKTPL